MKKRIFALLLTVSLLLAGCSYPMPPEVAADGTPWSTEWVSLGAVMGVEPVEEWKQQRNEDVLAAEGMYFASWTYGEPELNEIGETVYPAQVFLVISQCESTSAAEQAAAEWRNLAEKNYIAEEPWLLEHTHGVFTMLPYRFNGEESNFVRGMAAFGIRGSLAINLEFSCGEDVALDPELTLTTFLDAIHFAE